MKVAPINFNYVQGKKGVDTSVKKGVISKPVKNAAVMSTAAASALAAASMVNVQKVPTQQEVEKKLLTAGYVKNNDRNCFDRKNPPEKDLKLYADLYGQGSDIYLSNVMNLSQDNVKTLVDFLNIDPKRGAKMYHKHFDDMLTMFCNVKFNNQLDKLHDKTFYTMITDTIMNMPDEKTIKAFNQYKGKVYEEGLAKTTQMYLRGNSPESKNDKNVQDFIKNISSYIDTQKVPEGSKIYRGERFYVLDNVKLQDGKDFNLTELMKKAAESKKPEDMQKVKDLIKDKKPTATQPAFMSASLTSEGEFERKGWIFWELEVEPNTKGVYLDGINTSFYTFQQELLLQKGSKIKIEDATYDASRDIWHMKGKVSN